MKRTIIVGQIIMLLALISCADSQAVMVSTATAVIQTTRPSTVSLPISEDGFDLVLQGGGAKGLAHIGAIYGRKVGAVSTARSAPQQKRGKVLC